MWGVCVSPGLDAADGVETCLSEGKASIERQEVACIVEDLSEGADGDIDHALWEKDR